MLMNTISMSQTCLYNISYKITGNLKEHVHYKLNHNILNRTRYCPNKSALLLMSGHMTVNYIVVTIGQFLEKGKRVTSDDSSPVPKHRRTSRPNRNNGSSQSDSSMYAGHTGHTHRSSHSHLDTKTHRSNSPPQVVDTSPHIHSNRTLV